MRGGGEYKQDSYTLCEKPTKVLNLGVF